MTDSNGSDTPRERPVRQCPDELRDLVDFMARLILLVVVVAGPAIVVVWLAMSALTGRGRDHQGAYRYGHGVVSVALDLGRAAARSWGVRVGAFA